MPLNPHGRFALDESPPQSPHRTPTMDLSLTDLDEHALLEDVETLLNSEVFLGPGWELVGSLSTDSENETPRSSQSWKHHIYRQRLKNEREILRLQEKEFIQQLIQLKHVQKRTTTNEKNTRPTAYFLTKAFATRQKEERLCAEAEQKSLVLAVKAQAERIKAVSSVFRKRLNQISHRNYQDQTKLEMHQELERLLFFLVQSIDWMAIKHSTFRNLYAALTSSYGAAQATMNAEMEMLTHAVNSEDNTTIIGNRNDTGMNNSSVDHYNGSSEAQTPVADKIQTKCVRRIPYNQKQKAERASLNRQVKELTKQLKILRTRKTAAKSARGRGETSDAAWETLAKRQLQARLIAEEEYRQLFQDVEERSDLIENIGMIFRKRTRAEVTSGVCSLNKTPRFKSPDVTLYEMYVNQLDEVYGQTDKLFNEILVEKSTHASNYYMESRLATHGTTYRELVGSEIAPFPFAQVRHVVCRCHCMLRRPGSETYTGPGISESTTAVKVRITGPGNEESASSLVQLAIMRRYDEDNRVVNVWKKCTDGQGEFAGMHGEETGWCVVRPSENNAQGTVMESIVRFTPLPYNTTASSNATLTKFIDAVFNVREADCQSCGRDLERKMRDIAAH